MFKFAASNRAGAGAIHQQVEWFAILAHLVTIIKIVNLMTAPPPAQIKRFALMDKPLPGTQMAQKHIKQYLVHVISIL